MPERTLALIKPDATGKPWLEEYATKVPPPADLPDDAPPPVDEWTTTNTLRSTDKRTEILKRIERAGFKIVQQKTLYLSKSEAEQFYAEHNGRPFFNQLTSFMSSGATTALVLEKDNAIKEWRNLMGPTNSIKAREVAESEHPLNEELWSLRAVFGTDGTRNATHGSDSPYSAWREIGFFFPEAATFERSIALVLPHATTAVANIVTSLENNDFYVLGRKTVTLKPEQAALFTDDTAVQNAIVAGPAEAIIVEKVAAVRNLRLLAGPAPSVAKSAAPQSLHALFGTDDASVGVVAALTADNVQTLLRTVVNDPLPIEKTLAVVKPGTADSSYREIIADILANGFTILAETRRQLSRDEVENFYAEHKGKGFFDGLCTYMSSGPVVALALAKPNAIRCWRMLMGPTNTAIAKRDKPDTLRARFGVDGTRNATHGSDSPVSAARELRFYFPSLTLDDVPVGTAAISAIRNSKVADIYDASKGFTVPKTLDSVLVDALAALARAKPSSDPAEAIRWLGNWLIDNNPRHGAATVVDGPHTRGRVRVSEPDDDDYAATAAASAMHTVTTVSTASTAVVPPSIVFVLGAPGSGKGTQCERIAKQFGYAHLSTGDLLRDEVKSGSPLGKELEAIMSSGALVSTDLVLRLLKAAMERSGGNKFLIDGYPRALDQAFAFEKTVGKPTFVLSFDASEKVLEDRLVERGKTSGRADDNVESIRKRFATFKSQSEPVIDFYSKLGLVAKINSERSVESVFADVQKLFKPRAVWVVGGPGAGRSTQCSRIANGDFGCTHISTGDLLRAEVAKGTELGQELHAIISRGDVVPTATTMKLLRDAMATNPTGRYVLDGFPRTLEQALAYEKEFGAPEFVLHLNAPDNILLSRAAQWNTSRTDTHKAVVRKQIDLYHKDAAPILDLYGKAGLLRTVDASRNADAVFTAVKKHFAPTIVFVLGGPGSGKGTQCANIVRDFGYTHLSAGDLLRAEVQRGSSHGDMINQHIVEGKIVPVSVTLNLLRIAMQGSRSNKFLIDGFPRAMDQALAFEREVGECSFVLFFDCPEETMRSRLLERGKTSGRADDNAASIVKRFRTFVSDSMPVINHYGALGKVRTVDATPSPDVVFAAVRAIFAPNVVYVLGLPGSGKGTQCANIVREFGYTHLSTGDLLRAEVQRGSEAGAELQALMAEGKLVPDETIINLLITAMNSSGSNKFLIDGFPRAMEQAMKLEDMLGKPNLVLHFDVPRDVVKARLLARGKSSGRADDNEAAIEKRFVVFDEQSKPVIAHYEKERLVRTISGLAAPELVFTSVAPLFQPQTVLIVGTVGSGRSELAIRAGRELSYHTLHVTQLLNDEVKSGSSYGKVIAEALAAQRTVPIDATLAVIKRAIGNSSASRFLIDGYPRVVSTGYPNFHDQIFAFEATIGAIKGAIHLDCAYDMRVARSGAKNAGEIAVLRSRVDTFHREKVPVMNFMEKLNKAFTIDTTKKTQDEVFELARPFLE